MKSQVNYLILLVLIHSTFVKGTLDVGIQVLTGVQCIPGQLSQPSSCRTCICVFIGIQFCSRACLTTTRPTRPTAAPGQITIYPILYPNPTTPQAMPMRRPPYG